MTEQPAFREIGKLAERWHELAERRRDHFAELYESGRWRLYYEEDVFRAQVREVARICDRWASILERHRQLLTEPQDVELRFAEPDVAELDVVVLEDAEPDTAARDRDAA
jgi:uncharacterized repeat protein (TIGR03809 family)